MTRETRQAASLHNVKVKLKLLRTPISRALLLAGVCLLAIAPFFWWGNPSGHDFEFHMFSWMEVLGQWKHGIVYPRWAALGYWGYGEARFLFYPPASWTLGAALGAALPWKMVPGAYCWIVLTLAGASMYRLAREWLPRPGRAVCGRVLRAESLPLVDRLLAKRLRRTASLGPSAAGTALSAADLFAGTRAWLSPGAVVDAHAGRSLADERTRGRHDSLLGGWAGAVLAVRERSWERSWRPLLRTSLAIALGAGLASFYLIPAVYEMRWVNIGEVLSPGVRPQDNFLFTIIADPDHNRFNLLVSTVALAEDRRPSR